MLQPGCHSFLPNSISKKAISAPPPSRTHRSALGGLQKPLRSSSILTHRDCERGSGLCKAWLNFVGSCAWFRTEAFPSQISFVASPTILNRNFIFRRLQSVKRATTKNDALQETLNAGDCRRPLVGENCAHRRCARLRDVGRACAGDPASIASDPLSGPTEPGTRRSAS